MIDVGFVAVVGASATGVEILGPPPAKNSNSRESAFTKPADCKAIHTNPPRIQPRQRDGLPDSNLSKLLFMLIGQSHCDDSAVEEIVHLSGLIRKRI